METRVHAVAEGIFHGEAFLFADDGTLMAIASQSGVIPRP